MHATHSRTADQLNRTFSHLGVHGGVSATDDGVVIPAQAARQLLSKLSFVQGGSRAPFVNMLLRRPTGEDIVLGGDQGRHLSRTLEDVERQVRRNAQLDRGQIPGAMMSAGVSRLIRRHPHLFGR